MDPRLLLVTQSGSVDALYSLIQKDPYILQNVDLLPFAHTPLHEASSTGNLDLAMELMILKPSFAKKLNTEGFSPLHLAVENHQVQLARELVNFDPDLIRVAGRKGMTPLHLVVKKGDVILLIKFLLACPESIKDTNVNGETALHIAVINDREKELEELIGLTKRLHKSDAAFIEFHVLNRLDRNGNTALQLAEYKKNPKILKCMSSIRNIQNKGGILRTNGSHMNIKREKLIQQSGPFINYGDSMNGEKMDHQSFNICSNQGNFWSLEGSNSENSDSVEERPSHEAMGSTSNSITKLEIPPLKTQPGRTTFVFSAKSPSRSVESFPLGPPKSLKITSNKAYAPPPPAPRPSMLSSASPPRPPPLPGSGGHKPPLPLDSLAPPMPSSAGPPRPPPPPSSGWPKSLPPPGAFAPPMTSSVVPPRPPPPPGSTKPKQPPPPPGSTVPKPPPPPGYTRPKKPPPPPGSSVPKPPPTPGAHGLKGLYPPPPTSLGLKAPRSSSGPSDNNAPKTKLKPLFWDKVQANPEHSMVWNHIRSGSFQFNEELIESLFGYVATDKNINEKKGSVGQAVLPQFAQILEPKKRQNLSILLRALNVKTEEVCDALREGKELPVEFIQIMLKTTPTQEEELKLRSYSGEISQLGSAERFLKAVFDIPFAFKRLETLLFMCTVHEEMEFVKESFRTLEVACKELRGSRLFMKLLEAVLKTGNRMNDRTFRGGAQAFKLDTLLKLADVKGTDGKTTLLHFVVQEIIRSEGIRAARTIRESQSFSSVKTEDLMAEGTSVETEENYHNVGLQKVSGLSSELKHVKKAANIDADGLIGTVLNMGNALSKARDFVYLEMKSSGEDSGFREALKDFIQNVEGSIMSILGEENRVMALVKRTGDYFQGKAGKDEGLRLFLIVRDFLIILDKSCKEVREDRGRLVKMA